MAILGLIRLFRIAPWGYPLAGLFAGPVRLALFFDAKNTAGDRGGAWLLGAVLGLLIGALEWARVRRTGEDGHTD